MKYKHLGIFILLLLSISGCYTIEKYPTIMGLLSVLSILLLIALIIDFIIEKWNDKL